MLVFLVTVIAVAGLLVLDKRSSVPKEPTKYTNLDWEVVHVGERWDDHYYGHIYSVVKNKVVTVYKSKLFTNKAKAAEYIQKICQTMKTEYGIIINNSSIYESNGIDNSFDFSDLM